MFVQFSFIFIARITLIDGVPGRCDESSIVCYILRAIVVKWQSHCHWLHGVCAFQLFWNNWTISDAFESRGLIFTFQFYAFNRWPLFVHRFIHEQHGRNHKRESENLILAKIFILKFEFNVIMATPSAYSRSGCNIKSLSAVCRRIISPRWESRMCTTLTATMANSKLQYRENLIKLPDNKSVWKHESSK